MCGRRTVTLRRRKALFIGVVICFTVSVLAALLMIFLLISDLVIHRAHAHSWYDWQCCSDKDCHPIPPLVETPQGYVWRGRVVTHAETKPSADNDFHECVGPTGNLICLYVPPRGM